MPHSSPRCASSDARRPCRRRRARRARDNREAPGSRSWGTDDGAGEGRTTVKSVGMVREGHEPHGPLRPPTIDCRCGDVHRRRFPVRHPMQAKSEPALRLARSDTPASAPSGRTTHLTDIDVERNPGTPLDLDIVRGLRVNRSAVERRAATVPTRRTVKNQWQAGWLLRAITLIDLTALARADP